MDAVLAFMNSADQMQRYDAIRRRNADQAYGRQKEFQNHTKQAAEQLEALLRGVAEPMEQTAEVQQLNAGQLKNISIPVGKTLEETIDIWRDVRRQAYSVPEPTTADYQLASKATAKIAETELQLALHNRAKTIRDQLSFTRGTEAAQPIPSLLNATTHAAMERVQRWYDTAVSAYTVQNEAKQNQYQLNTPVLIQMI